MPKIIDAVRRFLRQPTGFNADGRVIGLGLATAIAEQRARTAIAVNADDVDRHLRRWSEDERLGVRG